MSNVEAVDVEGAIMAYVAAVPGLTGTGNPLPGGLHMSKPKVPSVGAIAELAGVTQRSVDDITDNPRISFRVLASGSEQRAREVSEAGARALLNALLRMTGDHQIVQTRRGEWVRILVAGDASGPIFAGESGGSAVHRIDVAVKAMPAGAPYGDGVYGAGIYGG